MKYDEVADFAEKRKYITDLKEMMALAGIVGAENWRSIEIGGDGGILAGLMADQVQHVVSTDIVTAQAKSGGTYLARLQEKFDRHEEELSLDRVEFLTADAQNLPFRDNWFDFSFSQNAFEHIPNPEIALREAFRVTKPGGYIYLMFDPVWTADSGSHFIHRIGQPWQHLLDDDDTIVEIMRSNGADEQEMDSYRSHMNRLPISYYLEAFPRVIGELGGKVIFHHQWSGCVDSRYVDHPNRKTAAERLGLEPDALLIRGLRYFLQV